MHSKAPHNSSNKSQVNTKFVHSECSLAAGDAAGNFFSSVFGALIWKQTNK